MNEISFLQFRQDETNKIVEEKFLGQEDHFNDKLSALSKQLDQLLRNNGVKSEDDKRNRNSMQIPHTEGGIINAKQNRLSKHQDKDMDGQQEGYTGDEQATIKTRLESVVIEQKHLKVQQDQIINLLEKLLEQKQGTADPNDILLQGDQESNIANATPNGRFVNLGNTTEQEDSEI